MDNLLEEYFDEFLDSDEAETLFSTQFSVLRKVYAAGFKAGLESRNGKQGQIIKLEVIENRNSAVNCK
ncbi:MAG: hypothetical protein ACOYBG_06105 [Eubacteriales bacterium]|jgi:hypothetical protein